MPQATKRPSRQRRAAGDADLVRALYDVAAHARRFQSADPVDTASVRLLYALGGVGDFRPSDLATAVGLDLSTVSRHLRALESKGLIARTGDPDDGRAQRVGVTAAGVEAVQEVIANRVAALSGVLDTWPAEEQAELGRLLRRLADDLQAAHCPSPRTLDQGGRG